MILLYTMDKATCPFTGNKAILVFGIIGDKKVVVWDNKSRLTIMEAIRRMDYVVIEVAYDNKMRTMVFTGDRIRQI